LAGLQHPSKFQRLSRNGFVTAMTSLNGSESNVARCLGVTWAGRLYIHFLLRNRILQVQNSLCVLQVLHSPIGSITARHLSTEHEQNFAALSRGRHLYSAGRPSRWALAHILVMSITVTPIKPETATEVLFHVMYVSTYTTTADV